MRKSLFLMPVLLWTGMFLGACSMKPDVFDESEVPRARADLLFDIDLCNLRNQNLNSKTESVECWLAAQQRFVADIKLARPDLFTGYAARVRMLATQADDKTITPEEFGQKYRQLTNEFDAAVFQSQDAERAR